MTDNAHDTSPTQEVEGTTTVTNDTISDTHSAPSQPCDAELAEQYREKWMRAVAESDNLRKRFEKEKEDGLKYAITKFARDILSVSDNIHRAIENCPKIEQSEGNEKIGTDDFKALLDGLHLVQGECHTIFERHGIQKIHPLGEIFNPDLHQAMFEIPSEAPEHVGLVAQVLQSGYVLHGRILRPALVGIYKGA